MKGLCEELIKLIPPEVQPTFVGEVPSQSTEGVALCPKDAEISYYFFGQESFIHVPYIECNIRTKTYKLGEDYAYKVMDAIDGYTDGNTVLGVRTSSYPDYLGKNEDKLHEFQLTFKVILLKE